jgi:hypothetical protein
LKTGGALGVPIFIGPPPILIILGGIILVLEVEVVLMVLVIDDIPPQPLPEHYAEYTSIPEIERYSFIVVSRIILSPLIGLAHLTSAHWPFPVFGIVPHS